MSGRLLIVVGLLALAAAVFVILAGTDKRAGESPVGGSGGIQDVTAQAGPAREGSGTPVGRETLEEPTLQQRFLRELDWVLEHDPEYARTLEENAARGDEIRATSSASRIQAANELAWKNKSPLPPPRRDSELWSLDGAALDQAGSLLGIQAKRTGTSSEDGVRNLERIAATDPDDMNAAIVESADAVAEYVSGVTFDFRGKDETLLPRLAEIRDRYVLRYAQLREKEWLLRIAMSMACTRADLDPHDPETASLTRGWFSEYQDVVAAIPRLGDAYLAEITAAVSRHLESR